MAELVSQWLGIPLTDIVRTRSGTGEADIGLSQEVQARFPFWIECKHHASLKVPAWIRQAEEAVVRENSTHLTPVIVFKLWSGKVGENAQSYVVIEFNKFMELATR